MKGKILWYLTPAIMFALVIAMVSWAAVPPPPVNQLLGIPDSVFNNLREADCRVCHQQEQVSIRHHNLVTTPISCPSSALNASQKYLKFKNVRHNLSH